jgi:molybdopterin-guanine dinucleotide biosynthesis protein A
VAAAGAAHAVSVDPESGDARDQPLCCLVARSQGEALAAYLASGRRSARGFLAAVGSVGVPFLAPGDDPLAFVNVNAPGTLAAWNGRAQPISAGRPAPNP